MKFKSFSLRWWWYGMIEDLHKACENELQTLEAPLRSKEQDWMTPPESLPRGWQAVAKVSLNGGDLPIYGPYRCIWESPEHRAIRGRYAGKIFQRRISAIPSLVGVLGGLLGIVSFILQCIK